MLDNAAEQGSSPFPTPSGALLCGQQLTKSYGGAIVLDRVDIAFHPGEVHALLGENGAGKSTLVKIFAGVIEADSGIVGGTAFAEDDIAMVFQELSTVPELSILDNLALSAPRRGLVVPYRSIRKQALGVLELAGLSDVDLGSPVAVLSLAQRQLLEIARALMVDAKVLILDEPTATLSDAEIVRVHAVAKRLVARGHAVLYITHRLGEVFSLSDRITILRAGRVAATGRTTEFQMDDVVAHMLGADHQPLDARGTTPTHELSEVALKVSGLSSLGRFTDVSFDAARGSVLALFGQIGSGADELVKTLAGIGDVEDGTVTLDDAHLTLGSRSSTQRAGVAYVSADRVADGVFLNASVVTNVSSGALARVSDRFGMIRRSEESALAREQAARVALDPKRVHQLASTFSGGNQQKIALARALATRPSVLVLNEPTRGVDIGARAEIYRSIRSLLDDDVVVVVYSSDIIEIHELADRVLTMYRGRVVGDHLVDEIDDATLTTEILKGAAT